MIEYMALFDNSRFQSLKVEHKMRYLSDIISEHKKSNVSAWDNIAKSMNVYLFEQKARSSEDFFLNATDCEHFFGRFFCTSSVPKQFASINSSIVELRPYIKEVQSACYDEQLLWILIALTFNAQSAVGKVKPNSNERFDDKFITVCELISLSTVAICVDYREAW